MKHPLFDQRFCRWSMCNFLIQAIRTHMFFELLLLGNDARGGICVREDIAFTIAQQESKIVVSLDRSLTLDEVLSMWSPFKALLQTVAGELMLELKCY